MDVFIPDATTLTGRDLAEELLGRGHDVLSCRRSGQSSTCAVLDDRPCPLHGTTADVALAFGEGSREFERGDGATCAIVHRVPLVLIEPDPKDSLVLHAASTATLEDAVDEAEAVAARPLPVHTDLAKRVVAQALERMGSDSSFLTVEVWRRSGSLLVELRRSSELRQEALERIATHVVQALREYDGFARGIDVVVRA
jgi:hypothetical protein